MEENVTIEEMEKAREAFYHGDIGNDNETGFKLLKKDEETINLIGKVLFNLTAQLGNQIDRNAIGNKKMEKLIVKLTNFCVDKHPDKSDMPRADYYHAVGQTLTEVNDIYQKYYVANSIKNWEIKK